MHPFRLFDLRNTGRRADMLRLVLFFFALSLAACATETGNYWHDVVRPREAVLLGDYADIVRRDGSSLAVHLADGRWKIYRDADDQVFFASAVSPDRRFIAISIAYREGGSEIILDRVSEAEFDVPASAHPSPTGKYWAVVDGDMGFGTGTIGMVVNEAGKLRLINSSGSQDNCAFENWQTDSAFRMVCRGPADRNPEYRLSLDPTGQLAPTPTNKTATDLAFEALPYW